MFSFANNMKIRTKNEQKKNMRSQTHLERWNRCNKQRNLLKIEGIPCVFGAQNEKPVTKLHTGLLVILLCSVHSQMAVAAVVISSLCMGNIIERKSVFELYHCARLCVVLHTHTPQIQPGHRDTHQGIFDCVRNVVSYRQ